MFWGERMGDVEQNKIRLAPTNENFKFWENS